MIKYLGSKRVLVARIAKAIEASGARTVLDLFSGTSRVGHALKRAGFEVTANDHNSYAHTLARCYVEADRDAIADEVTALLAELSELPGKPGYFTKTFCEASRYVHPKNGARVDAIRDAIEARDLSRSVKAVALTSLMEATDRVDSTTGVQMAYLKQWAKRAHNDLTLRFPDVVPGPGRAVQLEAREAAAIPVDVAYLDPPYNQHSYLGNYHVWETLVRWDEPEHYGIACKRIDCRERKSDFNSKRRFLAALTDVVKNVAAETLVVSFSNEGYIARDAMEELLSSRGHVEVADVDFKRYVGAQIGIFNPSGKKVGKVSHLRNKEHLFVVSPDREKVRAMMNAFADVAP